VTDLATLVARLQADNSQYIKALDQATGKLDKFSKDQDAILESIAGKFAAALSVGALAEFTASSLESAASLDRLSQSAGVSVESLSSLKLAAAAAGLDQDQLALGLKKVNQSLAQAAGDSTTKAGEAYRALGISVTNANGSLKTADQILPEIADKFKQMADGPNKVAIAVAIGGKAFDKFIPVLNQGSEGLQRFKDAAEAAGLIVSKQTAEAAEQFAQKAAVLKSELVDGLGVQLAAKLLPTLNALADAFLKGGTAGQTLATVADIIVAGLRVVGTIGLEIARTFTNIGDGLGSLAAQAVAIAHGHWAEATRIAKDGGEQELATNAKFAALETALWHDQSAQEIADAKAKFDAKEALDSKKGQGANLEALAKSDAAVKELQKFNSGIKDQALAFGLGGAALTNYKLQFGPLADAIAEAGAKGQALAAQIRANAAELQKKQDSKAIDDANNAIIKQIALHGQGAIAAAEFESKTGKLGDAFKRLGTDGEIARLKFVALKTEEANLADHAAVTALDDKMKQLAGDTAAAVKAAFDLKNVPLRADLKATGNTADLAKVDAAEQQEVLQARINDLNTKAAQIETDLSVAVTNLTAKVALGQLTTMQGEQQIAAARSAALAQLQQIGAAEQQIADAAGSSNIALVDGVKKFQSSLVNLQVQAIDPLITKVRDGLESAFANNFEKLISGAESFRKAALGMLRDIESQMLQMVSKNLAQQIFGASGPGGGAASGLASLFGGGGAIPGFASGGTLSAGSFGMVGEHGPELVYSGAKDLQISPTGAGKSVQVTNHFSIQAGPSGTISRASQMQTAAAAARSIGQANRRNNS
jgi:hypothetical protein